MGLKKIKSAGVMVVLAGLLLTGCGGNSDSAGNGGNGSGGNGGTNEEPVLHKAVQSYSDAFLTGKAASYRMLSARCHKRISRNEWSALMTVAKAQYGKPQPIRTFKAEISGDLARVTYTYDTPKINQTSEPWVREAGKWKEDDC